MERSFENNDECLNVEEKFELIRAKKEARRMAVDEYLAPRVINKKQKTQKINSLIEAKRRANRGLEALTKEKDLAVKGDERRKALAAIGVLTVSAMIQSKRSGVGMAGVVEKGLNFLASLQDDLEKTNNEKAGDLKKEVAVDDGVGEKVSEKENKPQEVEVLEVKDIPKSSENSNGDILRGRGEEMNSMECEDSAGKIKFDLNQPIELDKKDLEAAEEYFIQDHSLNGSNFLRFEDAFYRMEDMLDKIKEQFEQEGVSGDYAYIAIAESYFDSNAVSGSGATGAFQFMEKTAKTYGLIKKDSKGRLIEDKRREIIPSARACAQNLKYLYDVFGDWDLALFGYNKHYVWDFRKAYHRNPSRDEFIGYIGRRASKLRSDHTKSKKIRKKELKKLEENINYVAKVRAIMRLAKEKESVIVSRISKI